MVLQEEFTEEFIGILNNQSYTADIGETATVSYYDNALDTVHESDVTVTKRLIGNELEFIYELGLDDAVGDDINASLLKINTKAFSKVKHTEVSSKDDSTRIITKINVEFVPFTE